MSFGSINDDPGVRDAVIYANFNDCVLVAAAGNDGSNIIEYPAKYPEVIAVGATDGSDAKCSFSNYGPEQR